MKKAKLFKLASPLLALALVLALVIVAAPQTVSAATLDVGAGLTYETIQAAIDAAGPGDTITVAAGTYAPFTVDTKTGLTIQSSGVVTVQGAQLVTTAYGDRGCVVFVKDSTDVVLDGLDIEGSGLAGLGDGGKNYGVIYENSSGEINDCTVSPNTVSDMNSVAIGIWDDSTVTVDTCTIHNFGRVGMLIYNGCTVSVLDSTIEGQVYSGEGEVCYGIEVEGVMNDDTPATASQVTISGNEIYNCDNTFYEAPTWQSGGVYINGWLEYYPEADSTVIVENNNIHDNYSGIIVIKSSLSYAHYNNIYDNRAFGVESLVAHDASTAVFDATLNWWGDSTGPTHATNPEGLGDAVSDNVDYDPWLDLGTTTLSGDPRPSIEISAPGDMSGWLLTPGITNTKTGTLNVKCNTTWQVSASDEDAVTDGRMTKWDGSYVPAVKLANYMEVWAETGAILPTGGVIQTGDQTTDGGDNVTVTFKQTGSYGDDILGSPDCYRIVVTFTGTALM